MKDRRKPTGQGRNELVGCECGMMDHDRDRREASCDTAPLPTKRLSEGHVVRCWRPA